MVQNHVAETSTNSTPHVEMFHCNAGKRKMFWLDEYKRHITNCARTTLKPDCMGEILSQHCIQEIFFESMNQL